MTLITKDDPASLELRFQEIQADHRERHAQLRGDARASYRAFQGWAKVRTEEEWVKQVDDSQRDYQSGRFLIERLGAERYLDPPLMATLLGRRQRLLAELPNAGAAESMLIDGAVLAYFNMIRVQGWLGNLAADIEHELFAQPVPTATLDPKSGDIEGLAVEEHLKRVGEQLFPLLDRANKMMLRNLKAARELRRGPTPAVAIGRAEQVNVGERLLQRHEEDPWDPDRRRDHQAGERADQRSGARATVRDKAADHAADADANQRANGEHAQEEPAAPARRLRRHRAAAGSRSGRPSGGTSGSGRRGGKPRAAR
jgi:hypothetical protein